MQCVSQCYLSIPSNEVELKILIVSNYLLNYDGGVARGYRPSMNCSRTQWQADLYAT